MPSTASKSAGLLPTTPEHFRAEVSDQLFRQDGANPFHEAAGQVPFYTLARGWRDGFQDTGLELETVLLVPDPPAFGSQPLPSTHGRQGAKDRHLVPLASDLYPKYGEPALFIEEGDPLYESGDLFGRGMGLWGPFAPGSGMSLSRHDQH
jgi:hypothetical protein